MAARDPRFVLALIAAAGVAGCAKQRTFIQLPGEIDYVALLELDAGGTLVGASAIEPYDADDPPAYAARADGDDNHRLYFIGWTSDQLSLLTGNLNPTQKLERAIGCRSRLPAPAFYAKIEGESLAAEETTTAPALGAPWLDDVCPADRAPDTAILECESASEAPLTKKGPCAYTAQLTAGVLLDLTLHADGTACANAETPAECAGPVEYRTGQRLLCEAAIDVPEDHCKILLYQRPPVPSFSIDTLSLGDVTDYLPDAVRQRGDLHRDQAKVGYAYDLLPVAGDRVLVSLDSVLDEPKNCFALPDPTPAELRAYDGDTLQLAWSREAPPCLQNLMLDPRDENGAQFFGVFRLGAQIAIGHFDEDGALTRTATLAPDAMPRYVFDTLMLPERNEVVLILESLPRRTILALDLDTFAERERAPSALQIHAIEQLDAHTLVFSADPNANRCVLDLDDPDTIDCIDAGCYPAEWTGLTHELFDAHRDPRTGLELISVSLSAPSIWVCTETPRSISFYELLPQPALMMAHPADPNLLLISGISIAEQSELIGTLDVLDIERGRILPGTMPLTGMYTGRLHSDALGRVWLLHPWSAEVARLTAAREE